MWRGGRTRQMSKKGEKTNCRKRGKRLMVIEGDQRERYKSAIPSLTFWQTLSKLNFRIWKKGAQCLRIPRLAPSLFMSATYGPPEPLSIYNRNLFARRVRQLEERLVFSRLLPRFSRNRGNCAETLDPRVRMRKRNGKKSRGRGTRRRSDWLLFYPSPTQGRTTDLGRRVAFRDLWSNSILSSSSDFVRFMSSFLSGR